MNKQIKVAIIIFIVLIAVLAGYYGYISFRKYIERVVVPQEEISRTDLGENQNPASEPAEKPKTSWKLYKNSDFGFEIQYPENWAVAEENIENVRGENTKGFFFKKPGSDLRFAVLPRDGLSYGLPESGITTKIVISGSVGSQTQYILADGRRLLLVHPQYALFNWSGDIGRLDIMSSVGDPTGDFKIFNQMLQTFKLITQQ